MGGSNAAGTIFHYIDDERVQIVLAEAGGKGIETGMSAATIQLGKMGIIHGAKTLVIQNEDGQIEEPYSISAGLDYPVLAHACQSCPTKSGPLFCPSMMMKLYALHSS